MLGEGCGGCPYHYFPYEATIPILINGKREKKKFNDIEDVWNVIALLTKEIYEENKKGNEFSVSESINAQLPFFACKNKILDKQIEKDIQRYIYCKDLNVSPYEGSYGQQPALWVDKSILIKRALAKKEKVQIDKVKKEKLSR